MEQLNKQPKTHILDLNDSCLLEILEKLDVVGLCSFHETCTRFSALSELAFRVKFGDSFINPFSRTEYPITTQAFKQNVIQTQIMVIKCFARNIKRISVTNFANEDNMTFNQFLALFKKYLHSVEELELFQFTINYFDNKITGLNSNWNFYRLQRLILRSSVVNAPAFIPFLQKIGFKLKYFDCESILRSNELTTYDGLSTDKTRNLDQISYYINFIPNVTELRVSLSPNSKSVFQKIFDLLPQLKSLSVKLDAGGWYYKLPYDPIRFLQPFASKLINLKKFEYGPQNYNYLNCITYEKYKIQYNWNPILPYFVNLEHLHVKGSSFGNIGDLSVLRNIKTLYLENDYLTVSASTAIAKSLIDLKFLTIIACKFETGDEYDEIYEFGKHAHKLETISIIDDHMVPEIIMEKFQSLPVRKKPLRILQIYMNTVGIVDRFHPKKIETSRNVSFECIEDREFEFKNRSFLTDYQKCFWNKNKRRMEMFINKTTKCPMELLTDTPETYLVDPKYVFLPMLTFPPLTMMNLKNFKK